MRRRLHRQGPLRGPGRRPLTGGPGQAGHQALSHGRGPRHPVGVVVAPANRHDSPLLAPTLECLGRFGFDLPEHITVHLDAGYDSRRTRELLEVLGCDARISPRGTPLQAGRRWVIERTNAWHTRGFRRLQVCTEVRTQVIEAFIALANTIITIRNLIHHAWTTHRWAQRPTRKP